MTLSPMMKKTMVITAAALRSLSPGIAPSRLAGWAPLTRIPRRAMRARRFAISHSTRNLCRRSRGRRTDESILHEEFRFLAGPSNQLEGSLIEGVSGLRLPRDSLLHRLEGYRGRLPGEHVDLIHRGHDVRLVEALFLCDLRELLRRRDAHLVRDRPRTDVQGATENPGETQRVVHLVREIGPTCGDDTGSGLGGLPWPDFRHGVRDHEEDGVVRHRSDPILLDHAGSRLRCGDCDVRVSHRLRDATLPIASVRLQREFPFLRVIVRRDLDILSMTTDDSFRVDEDDVLRVLRREGDRECVDAAEVFEQQGLALHHRQSGFGPDVPEAEDASAVRDDRDLIPLVRQGPNLARVRRDVEAGLRDPGRVPDREIVEAPHRHAGHDLDLALIVRVVLRRLFLREVRALQVLLDFLERRRLHLLATRALLRGYHRSTRKELGEETRWLP